MQVSAAKFTPTAGGHKMSCIQARASHLCLPTATLRPLAIHRSPPPPPRVHSLTPALRAAATDLDGEVSDGDLEDEMADGELEFDEFPGVRLRDRGYTPFEFIEFTSIPLKHEVSVWVDRPVADCYKLWHNRLNWMQWFSMIDEVGFHEEEPSYMSMYLWYRWATTPFLELYVTLERTQEEENKYILEEPVEGLPLVAAVLFQEGDEGDDGQESGTTVTLRLSYLLPKVLHEFAGQVAVYGDVDRKLQGCMVAMKEFIEGADLAELEAARLQNEQEITANFALQREQKTEAALRREARAAEWEAAVAAEENSSVVDVDADGDAEQADVEAAGGKKVTRRRAKEGAEMNNPAARQSSNNGGE